MLGANVWSLDWLTFRPEREARDVDGVQWILLEEKGFWGTPGPSASLSPRLNNHGAYRSPGWKTERTISLVGRCYADDFLTLRRAEAKVLGLLSDPRASAPLVCHTEFGGLMCEVYLDDAILCSPVDTISEPGIEFSMQVIAPDPRKYAVEEQTLSTGLPSEGLTGLDFNETIIFDPNQGLNFFGLVDGLEFGDGNASGVMLLGNVGTAPTTPTFTLHGPLTFPTLAAGAFSLRYNERLRAGEHLVIDPAAPSVLLGGSASRRELLYPAQFQGFEIPAADPDGTPGQLAVGLSHTGPVTDAGYVEATFRSAWF